MHTRVMAAGTALACAIAMTSFLPAATASGSTPAASLKATGSAAAAGKPTVLNVGKIDVQDVKTQAGCEGDTLVEPDVAVSPTNSDVAVAVAHDCRFVDGGAVDISYAWTADGGKTWAHAPVPDLTTAVGGAWDRASDPVVDYGPDGTAYMSALVLDVSNCDTGIAVLRSTDGGKTWQKPVLAQSSTSCANSDDKDWLVVDNGAKSSHKGRLYAFWTDYITQGSTTTSPQVVRYSDDGGKTWSKTYQVNPTLANTQSSQPLIEANGTIVDTYLDYGKAAADDGPDMPRPSTPGVSLDARTSTDGGQTWGAQSRIAKPIGGGPVDVRCCLNAAAIDPVTGKMYAVWEGSGPSSTDPVEISTSANGSTWKGPLQVTTGDKAGVQRVNATVTAYNGEVFVSYGTRTDASHNGGYVQQQMSWSTDGGATFQGPKSLGPVSVLRWAAKAPDYFPGDYIGAASTAGKVYLVWCRSSKPPAKSGYQYWQTLWEATLAP